MIAASPPLIHADYIDRGLSLVPLKPGAKQPFGKWRRWMQTPMTAADLDTWWGGVFNPAPNVGIITGIASGGLVVLDVEPEHVEDWMYRESPVQVRTARGGLHLYFQGDSLCGKLRARGTIVGDIRGDGGYVVAPPSTTPHGAYEWGGDSGRMPWRVDQLPELPDWAENRTDTGGGDVVDPPVLVRLSPSEISLRLPASLRQTVRSGWSPSGAFGSASELDFAIVREMVYLGQDIDSIRRFFRAYPIGENLGRHGPSYLTTTYRNACKQVAQSTDAVVELQWHRTVLAAGTMAFGAKRRALVEFTDGEIHYPFSIPFILSTPYEDDLSGEWIQICSAYGVAPTEDTSFLDDRWICGMVGTDGRVKRLWREDIYAGFAL